MKRRLIIIAIGSAVFLFLVFMYFESYLVSQTVAPVSFYKKSILLDIQYVAIKTWYNPYGLVYPDDKLALSVRVAKKIPEKVSIKPVINIYVSGVKVKNSQDQPWHDLDSNEPTIFNYDFYAGSEGPTFVGVDIYINNPTDNSTLETAYGLSHTFEVLSTSDRLLSNQNTMILIGIVVSGVGTAIALSLTAHQTKLSRDEKNETQRAWVGNADSHIMLSRVFNKKNEVLTREEWYALTLQQQITFDYNEMEYAIKLKNFGKTIATNIRSRVMVSSEPKPERKVITEAKYSNPFMLFPNHEQLFMIKLSKEILDTIESQRKIYLIAEFSYNSGNSEKIRKFGFIAQLSTGGYVFLETWDENTF